MAAESSQLLRATGMWKSFGPVPAVADVSISVAKGEIVGLIGANGAGKSTLVKIITGNHRPDAGALWFDGEERRFTNPHDAIAAGIAFVPQEHDLVLDQTVAENVLLGGLPARAGLVRPAVARRHAAAALAELNAETSIDVRAEVGGLTPAQQRIVMIARGLSRKPKLLILDEPTASLPVATADSLLETLAALAERGTGVIYISHRLREIKQICDRVVALKNGRQQADVATATLSIDEMVGLVGGSSSTVAPPVSRRTSSANEVLVKVADLCGNRVRGASFEVARGDIVGLAGLEGSGRSELLRLLAGAQAPTAGTIDVLGRGPCASCRDAARRGVGYVTEGRGRMIFPTMDIKENLSISSLDRIRTRRHLLRRRAERAACEPVLTRMGVEGDPDRSILALSGGNQQKVLIGRWLLRGVRLLLLDEPTAGIDVAARAQIHQRLAELAAEGMGIVLASVEPEELAEIAQRVLVLVDGEIRHELEAPLSPDELVGASYSGK